MSDTGNNQFITLIQKKERNEIKLKIHFGYHQKNINKKIFFFNNNRNYILNNLIKNGRKVVFFLKTEKETSSADILRYLNTVSSHYLFGRS